VATVLVILLGAGVLLGIGALVIDVGQIYAEREQLQSGADSAAIALAKSCSAAPDACADAHGRPHDRGRHRGAHRRRLKA